MTMRSILDYRVWVEVSPTGKQCRLTRSVLFPTLYFLALAPESWGREQKNTARKQLFCYFKSPG